MIIANTAIYFGYLVLLRLGFTLVDELALTPRDFLLRGRLWQPVTYLFLHSPQAVSHLLFNMLFLWMFGSQVEGWVGRSAFYRIYLWSGLGGAALTVLAGAVAVAAYPSPTSELMWAGAHIGASGAVQGIVLYWGGRQWGTRLNFFLLGPMQVRTFVYILVVIEILVALSFDATSSTSHFGGMLVGFALGRGWLSDEFPRKAWLHWKHRRVQKRLSRFQVIEGEGKGRSRPPDGSAPWGRRPDDDEDDDPVVH